MTDSVADDQIKAFFERWQRLEEEKDAISGDLRELFAEMKANGFDTKVARAVFRDKTKDQNARNEFEAIYDLYWSALGTPRATGARPTRDAIDLTGLNGVAYNEPISSPVNESGHEEADGAFQAETQHSVPSAYPSASSNGDDGTLEGQEVTGAGTAGATPATGSNSEPQPKAAQTGGVPPAPPSVAGPEAVESPAASFPADAERLRPTQVAHGGIGGEAEPREGAPVGRSGDSEPPAHDPAPVDRSKPAPWCQDPDDCRDASWTHPCGSCLRRRAQAEAAGALQ